MKKHLIFLCVLLVPSFLFASSEELELQKVTINAKDTESLKRGADIFYANCVGCHSTKYMRYERIANDLKLSEAYVKANYMFNTDKMGDTVQTAMTAAQAKKWFGTLPPDLTLEANLRGKDWLYTYLLSFYPDEKRPWKYNNHVFKDVGMPNVLQSMQQELGEEKFKEAVRDLVNYMSYMAEPVKVERESLGIKVLIFLLILLIPSYFLKKEYWKDVH